MFDKCPGSMHDARVSESSDLNKCITHGELVVPNRYHILVDSADPASDFTLPPFRDNGALTLRQREFSRLHEFPSIDKYTGH